jgi:tRNA dimethylallyltransferase
MFSLDFPFCFLYYSLMHEENSPVVILGPTCVGKTNISIEVALSLGAEIISCDSRQVYIGMDIGTAKTPYHLRQIVPHHLVDIVYPDDPFNAQMWAERAEYSAATIVKKGKSPLIVCGTGLYLSAYTDGFFPLPERTEEKKREITERIKGIEKRETLYDYLKEIDPKSAKDIHVNDLYRTRRAIEIYLLTGKPLSQIKKESRKKKREEILYIGLTMEREKLYRRIDGRVDSMIKDGFIEEVISLINQGYDENLTAFQAPGYFELREYFKGKTTREEAISKTKTRTRNYAKRQFTWFRKMEKVHWFDVTDRYCDAILTIVELCKKIC